MHHNAGHSSTYTYCMGTKLYVIFQAEYNNLSVSNVQREIEQLRNDLVYLRPKRLCDVSSIEAVIV